MVIVIIFRVVLVFLLTLFCTYLGGSLIGGTPDFTLWPERLRTGAVYLSMMAATFYLVYAFFFGD